MNELKRQLDSRDGAEDFRDFLLRTYPDDGLAVFQLWLILNGYQKEVERYIRLHGKNETFIKWNIKCCKALSEKYFNSTSNKNNNNSYQINHTLKHALDQAYRKVRKDPNEKHSSQLTRILVDIFNSISLYIETKYYSVYKKTVHQQKATTPLVRPIMPVSNFFSSEHQNSKHMSPSGSDFTSSDNYSSVTDFCSVIDSNDYKRIKRRNKQIRRLHLLRNVITREHHNTQPYVPRLSNDADLATKAPAEFARQVINKLNKVIEAAEDDSILSEHLERVMKTPKDKPRPRRLNRLQSKSSNTKVCDWLETTVTIPVYAFSNNGISETSSSYEYTNYSKNDTGLPLMSSDSGLSSIRIDTEVELDDIIEDVKQRLIEETEGDITTKLLYHFKGEKFIVRVPGRPPTLLSLRQKMHCQGDYRFFVRSEDDAWVEITDDNEPLYPGGSGKIAEAKIVDRIYNA